MLCQRSLVVPILQLDARRCHARSARFTLQPVAQGAWFFLYVLGHISQILTHEYVFDKISSRFLVPDFYFRLVTRVFGLDLDRKDYFP